MVNVKMMDVDWDLYLVIWLDLWKVMTMDSVWDAMTVF